MESFTLAHHVGHVWRGGAVIAKERESVGPRSVGDVQHDERWWLDRWGGHGDPARMDEKASAAGLPAEARSASTHRTSFSRLAIVTDEQLRADRDLKERTARGVSAAAWP